MAAGGRLRWSWLYVCIVLWLASLTIPEFLEWRFASDPVREEGTQAVGWFVLVPLILLTVALGCAIGWQRRWTSLGLAVVLGALVQSVGLWVSYAQGWTGGEPMPEPGPFLMSCVILGILLGTGAAIGVLASSARHRELTPT